MCLSTDKTGTDGPIQNQNRFLKVVCESSLAAPPSVLLPPPPRLCCWPLQGRAGSQNKQTCDVCLSTLKTGCDVTEIKRL